MRIRLDLYTMLTSLITPFLNKITWPELWEVKSLEISFPPHSFPSITDILSYIYVSCKHIISWLVVVFFFVLFCFFLKHVNTDFQFRSEPPNVNGEQSKCTIASHKQSPWTNAKVRDTKSKQFTEPGSLTWAVTSSSEWCHLLHSCQSVWRFSGQARATRGITGIRPRLLAFLPTVTEYAFLNTFLTTRLQNFKNVLHSRRHRIRLLKYFPHDKTSKLQKCFSLETPQDTPS